MLNKDKLSVNEGIAEVKEGRRRVHNLNRDRVTMEKRKINLEKDMKQRNKGLRKPVDCKKAIKF